jgi:hypothetical protein
VYRRSVWQLRIASGVGNSDVLQRVQVCSAFRSKSTPARDHHLAGQRDPASILWSAHPNLNTADQRGSRAPGHDAHRDGQWVRYPRALRTCLGLHTAQLSTHWQAVGRTRTGIPATRRRPECPCYQRVAALCRGGRSGLEIRRVRLPYPVAIGGRGGPIGGGGPGGGGGGGPGGGGGNIESCMVSSS